jgi:hypothetical protein
MGIVNDGPRGPSGGGDGSQIARFPDGSGDFDSCERSRERERPSAVCAGRVWLALHIDDRYGLDTPAEPSSAQTCANTAIEPAVGEM